MAYFYSTISTIIYSAGLIKTIKVKKIVNIQWYPIAYTIYSELFKKGLVASPPQGPPQPQSLLCLGHRIHSSGTIFAHSGCSYPHCLFVQLFCVITTDYGSCTLLMRSIYLVLTATLSYTMLLCQVYR